jgi:DNA replication protein
LPDKETGAVAAFAGFKNKKGKLTAIPAQFFSELLPEFDHLGEMKTCLYAFWQLERMEGSFRWMMREDFTADERFMAGMGTNQQSAEELLDESLERAVGRGFFLKACFQTEAGERIYYFLNSPKGRAAVEAIEQGTWIPPSVPRLSVELNLERPNIFRLYEENIGPLTPLLAEMLQEAEDTYPEIWIEDACRIAVENNKRSWKYIDAILRRWQEGGRDEQNRRDSEKDRRRYSEWEN